MSINATLTTPTTGDLQTSEKIVGESAQETEWTDLVELQNWLYSRGGMRLAGQSLRWETNDTNFTVTNILPGKPDLDQWRPGTRLQRTADLSTGIYQVTVAAFGHFFDVEWTLVRRNADGTQDQIDQFTFSQTSGTYQWAIDIRNYSNAEASDQGVAGNRPVRIQHEVRARVNGGEKAVLAQLSAWETALLDSDIPTK